MAKPKKTTKNPKGLGSVYTDSDTSRRARSVAERTVRLPDGSRRRIRARAERQEDAIRLLNEKIAQAMDSAPAGASLTVDSLLARWLAHKAPLVRASTLADYTDDVDKYTSPVIGPLALHKLTPAHIQAVLDPILKRGHKRTAHRVWRTLKQALSWGVRMEYLMSSPADRVEPIKQPRKRVEAWTPAQASRFLRSARGTRHYPLYYMAISTGLRQGELLALEWADMWDGMIHVRRTISKHAPGGVAEGAKTPDGVRAVPISPDLAVVLREQRHVIGKSPLVFPGRRGARLSGSTISKDLRDLQERAGVPRITFHELRKTSASLLARSGASASMIQKRLGHATPGLAMTVYTKVFDEDAAATILDLSGLAGTGGVRGGIATARRYTLLGVWHRNPRAGLRAGHVYARRLRRILR